MVRTPRKSSFQTDPGFPHGRDQWIWTAATSWACIGLVARGVDINAVDRFGYTPILYSSTIDFGEAKTIMSLLSASADPNIKDRQGKSPWVHSANFPYIRAELEKAGVRQ